MIAGSRVQGVVDLLDVDGCIVDCKTATRRQARRRKTVVVFDGQRDVRAGVLGNHGAQGLDDIGV